LISTAIGSAPWTDPEVAIEKTWSSVDIPFWVQLPKRDWRELMIPQYAEGMPGVVFDDAARQVVCRHDAEALERFWASPEEFGMISRDCAAGLHAALQRLQNHPVTTFKVQTTGPVTFCCSVCQEDGTPIIADSALREAAWMLLAQKAIWQVRLFSPHSGGIIHFFDEPVLAALGANPSLTPQLVRDALTFVFETVKAACPDTTVGVHCCGNTDWELVLSTQPDILSFDAYYYGETLLLYPDALAEHAARGGWLAFGIVPTDETVAQVEVDELVEKFRHLQRRLEEKTGSRFKTLLTPACGTGSLSEQLAERVFLMLQEVAAALRE